MPSAGRRHRLSLYTYLINRWWQPLLWIGILLLVMTAALGGIPLYFPQFPVVWVPDWNLYLTGGAGGMAFLGAIFLVAIRKSAYVQPFSDHLRLVTPFLHLNISYRRIRRTYTAEMQQLYPSYKFKGLKRELIRPLASRTLVVLEMNQLPLGQATLRLFLSPFFFPDKTACLALLVADWLAFSTELDSFFSTFQDGLRQRAQPRGTRSGLLGSITGKSK
jgi:hypothetical protein